jgi:predicted O-linked N-acetylglucosamine transferase (SPINDLY family)
MGVPVITMTGERPMSRYGASVLSAVGLSQWIVANPEQYVDLVTKLASDLPALSRLRLELRSRIQHSTLTDEAGYARRLATVYRAIWRREVERIP